MNLALKGPIVAGLHLYATPDRRKAVTLNARPTRQPGRYAQALGLGLILLVVAACSPNDAGLFAREKARFASHELSDRGLLKLASTMDPSMRALTLRHDPGLRQPDLWARPSGWGRLDIDKTPDLGFGDSEPDAATALDLNALRPFSRLPIRPMRPFVLEASGEEIGRAHV